MTIHEVKYDLGLRENTAHTNIAQGDLTRCMTPYLTLISVWNCNVTHNLMCGVTICFPYHSVIK